MSQPSLDLLALAIGDDVCCIAVDLRGHGESSWADRVNFEASARMRNFMASIEPMSEVQELVERAAFEASFYEFVLEARLWEIATYRDGLIERIIDIYAAEANAQFTRWMADWGTGLDPGYVD